MGNLTLTKYFKNVKLADIDDGKKLDGIPDKLDFLLKETASHLSKLWIPGVFDFLSEPDPLFHYIYGYGKDDIFTYPFIEGKRIPEGIVEVKGPVGTQDSRYHRESLEEHVCLVAALLAEQGYFTKRQAVQLAVWHDIGKKYTTATNARGEICFYNHAQLSTYLAARSGCFDSDGEAPRLLPIIYGHMQPMTSWNQSKDWETGEPRDYKAEFFEEMKSYWFGREEFAAQAVKDIEMFTLCDIGVEDVSGPEIRRKIEAGRELIMSTLA